MYKTVHVIHLNTFLFLSGLANSSLTVSFFGYSNGIFNFNSCTNVNPRFKICAVSLVTDISVDFGKTLPLGKGYGQLTKPSSAQHYGGLYDIPKRMMQYEYTQDASENFRSEDMTNFNCLEFKGKKKLLENRHFRYSKSLSS